MQDKQNPRKPGLKFVAVMCATGLIAGLSAFLLKGGIKIVSDSLKDIVASANAPWLFLVLPFAGVSAAIVWQKYMVKSNLENGTHQVRYKLAANNPILKGRLTFAPLIANILTLGCGGSAGAEGPIAFSTSAVASVLGRRTNLNHQLMMAAVGCGAGAGIAAIFKAPIGGMLFAIEVVGMAVSTPTVLALVLACLIAGLTSFVLAGSEYPFVFEATHRMELSWLPWVIIIGIACGIYAHYYKLSGALTDKVLKRFGSVWIKGAAASAWMGILLFLFPAIYGEGFGVVNSLLNSFSAQATGGSILDRITTGNILVIILVGIALTKGSVTNATNHGGGVGGSFAPTLFAGCIFGYLAALGINHIPGVEIPVAEFAFIAMSGTMAGIIRAPFMAMFLAPEMSGNYYLFLPCVIASFMAWGTDSLCNRLIPVKES